MFKLEEFAGRRVLTSSLFADEDLIVFFTTRDLSLKAGERTDLLEEVENNKKLVCQELGIPSENLIIPQQTHSDNVRIFRRKEGKKERGKDNLSLPSSPTSLLPSFEETDALVTDQPNVVLALNFADCVPILFYDSVKKVIGASHAGWRGTAAKIAPKTVKKMIEKFSCNPADIIAVIGPAIGKCCFEVKEDVAEKLIKSIDNNSSAFFDNHADLKLINKLQLLACGIEKIDVCEYCTSCQNELFFSYRKEQGNTARHSAVIIVKDEA